MNKNLTPKRTIQQLLLIKRRLFKLGRSFLQLLIIVFVRLPVMVLMFIFPSLRRRLLPKTKKENSDRLSSTTGIREKLPDQLHPQLDFLVQVLRVTAESKGDSKVIYPFLQQNLDKLDDNFADILRNWATAKFSEVEADVAESIALCLVQFSSILIEQFPLGSKANNMEIGIAGYEVVLKIFTYKSHRKIGAMTQIGLGNAYRERIRGEKAENIEAAIAAYEKALLVYTQTDFPMEWAMTQISLGNAYSDRIRGDKAQNMESAIEAYEKALLVYTQTDFPMDWAMTQNNLGLAYIY
ncbi:MAG: tetratricopeptide repeat protein, partial [Trichodesmium sp. St15_bin1_1]|nr:tetratricopeptide repeat protein [Trichodesmium sp. St15_bin1_1]